MPCLHFSKSVFKILNCDIISHQKFCDKILFSNVISVEVVISHILFTGSSKEKTTICFINKLKVVLVGRSAIVVYFALEVLAKDEL